MTQAVAHRMFATRLSWALGLAICLVADVCGAGPRDPGDRPNFVFIMADDLGWADVGFHGAKFYETPNIDQLAAAGIDFAHAYSGGPNCLPTRACLLSGMYTPRYKIWTPGGRSKGKHQYMKLATPTRGVANSDSTLTSRLELEPEVTSIAEVLETVGYRSARFGKWHVGEDTQGFDPSSSDGISGPAGRHYDNVDVAQQLTDASLAFIEENRARPFLLYLAHWDVHTPIVARKDVTAKYEQKLTAQRWDRDWNPVYAAMIEAVDTSVGRVQAKIAELGLAENTLIVFSSDNGGLTSVTPNVPLKGGKGSFCEGGVRVPTCMTWPGTIEAGTRCDVPITSVDFMPTFAELSGADLPNSQPVDGASLVPLLSDSGSFADRAIFWHFPLYLEGHGGGNRVLPVFGTNRMYWRATPASMIRRGNYKLIRYYEDGSEQLYDVATDVSESHECSETHPAVKAGLSAELNAWLADVQAEIPQLANDAFAP